jgi:Domain of unknown function (DUF3644)
MTKRIRRVFSIKDELIKKSQEAALAAIQVFNNPLITFKSESFIVLMNIAWTYLLHAYYRDRGVEYRYFDQKPKRRIFHKTKHGAHKYWELEKCLNYNGCPLDNATADNLRFLIGIRHEIEHRMTDKIDDFISAKFQACCINYNDALRNLFGESASIDKTIPIALQLFTFREKQIDQLKNLDHLPENILDFVSSFETDLETREDSRYSYKVVYLRDSVNRENQADAAFRFVDESSAEGKEIHNILMKTRKNTKLQEKEVLPIVHSKGYVNFTKQDHQEFWKSKWGNAKVRNESDEAKRFGELIMSNFWLWYKETWIPEVLKYCNKNRNRYK